jgi:cell division protein FtsL
MRIKITEAHLFIIKFLNVLIIISSGFFGALFLYQIIQSYEHQFSFFLPISLLILLPILSFLIIIYFYVKRKRKEVQLYCIKNAHNIYVRYKKENEWRNLSLKEIPKQDKKKFIENFMDLRIKPIKIKR